MPGIALDLTGNDVDGKPWDSNDPEKRDKARDMVTQKKALLLITWRRYGIQERHKTSWLRWARGRASCTRLMCIFIK